MREDNVGIIRHIDDLGRIVIPKDIRRMLHINTGDPVEISAGRDGMLMKRYRPLPDLKSVCNMLLTAFGRGCSSVCVITDTEHVIASKGITVSSERPLSPALAEYIRAGKSYINRGDNAFDLFGGSSFPVASISSIIKDGRSYGAVILLQYNEVADWAYDRSKMLADTLSQILQDGE